MKEVYLLLTGSCRVVILLEILLFEAFLPVERFRVWVAIFAAAQLDARDLLMTRVNFYMAYNMVVTSFLIKLNFINKFLYRIKNIIFYVYRDN